MNIAWFTPFIQRSAIGKYGALFVKELLEQQHRVTIFADAANGTDPLIKSDAAIIDLSQTPLNDVVQMLPAFDAVFYNLGDSALMHQRIFDVSRAYPGIVILHDLVMHHFFFNSYITDKRNHEGYLRELTFSHGSEGLAFGKSALSGNESPHVWESSTVLDFHMAQSAINGAHGVITHSPYSERVVNTFSSAPVQYVPLPRPELPKTVKPQPHEGVRLVSFGLLNPNKMLSAVIEIIGEIPALREQAFYDIIGTGEPEIVDYLTTLIQKYNLKDRVKLHGYQPDDVLYKTIADADIVVNLRNPHFGESSATLVEAMLLGKPNIVWNHGDYAEFPDGAVIKADSIDGFRHLLSQLVSNGQLRANYAQAAQAHIDKHFVTAESAKRIVAFAEAVRANRLVLNTVDYIVNEMQAMAVDARFTFFPETVIRTLDALFILDNKQG